MLPGKIKDIVRPVFIRGLNYVGEYILRRRIHKKDFTVFSNDCYGAEIYRWLKIEYNTPFVGLMLMTPCYIKFLQNPEYYCSLPLAFIDNSMYSKMNELRKLNHDYPVGQLGDIEIHFLHYDSEQEARQKWEARTKRINWQSLKVKFGMDKDYGDTAFLHQFEALPYTHKISFSREEYYWAPTNITLPDYAADATIVFRNSLPYFNIISWLNDGRISFKGNKEKLIGKILYNTLRR